MSTIKDLLIPQAYAQAGGGGGGAGGVQNTNLGDRFTLGIGGDPVKNIYDKPADLVNVFVGNIFWIAGIILMITVILAGFKFIQSGTKGKDEAKQILTTALIGTLIMFSAYWIVQIVELMIGMEVM